MPVPPRSSDKPLTGIRILEAGRSDTLHLAGMLLADQGAEVIRVDAGRITTHDTAFHKITDRAKKSFLFHKTSEHTAALMRLVAGADLLLDDVGRGIDSMVLLQAEQTASVIRCTIAPSEDGTYPENWTEETVSAEVGLYEDGLSIGAPPRFYDLPIAATLGALYAVNAVARALVGHRRFGTTDIVRIPLDRICMLAQSLTIIIRSNPPTRWEPFRWVASPFMCTWRTAGNGCMYFHAGMPRHLRSFMFFLDKIGFTEEKNAIKKYLQPGTKRDPFSPQSVGEAIGITRVLRKLFLKKTADEWETLLGNAGFCCTKIRTFEEWCTHPQVTKTTQVQRSLRPDGSTTLIPGPIFDRYHNFPGDVAAEASELLQPDACAAVWPPRGALPLPARRHLPLEGIKVLDLGRVIAGPYSARLLAEAGAEVLHLSLRGNHLDWEEPFGIIYNQGKKSVAVDITRPEGRDAFRKIVTWYKPDIITHNFMDDAAEKIGCDYESCRKIDDKIICINFKGYAHGGPWADYPGFEQNVQSASGILGTFCGTTTPRILPVPMNDLCAGLIGSYGALLALFNREKEGCGDQVTSYIATPSILVHLHFLGSEAAAERKQTYHRYFKASDGWFLLSGRRDTLHLLGTIAQLSACDLSPATLDEEGLSRCFRKRPVQWWISAIKSSGAHAALTTTPRRSLSAVLKEELKRQNPLFSYRFHEGFGNVLCSRPPLVSTCCQVDELTTAPYPGSHNAELLPHAGFEATAHCAGIPRTDNRSSPIRDGVKRVAWILRQVKWLAVIAYRGWGMRLK